MIGVVASIALALYLRSYVPLLGVGAWLLSLRDRDLGLLGFSVYVLYLANSVPIETVYFYIPAVESLAVALSVVLLLEDVLKRSKKVEGIEAVLSLIVLGGALFPELLVAGAVVYLLTKLRLDYVALSIALFLPVVLILFEGNLNIRGGSSLQAGMISAFAVFVMAYGLTRVNVKKVKVFNLGMEKEQR